MPGDAFGKDCLPFEKSDEILGTSEERGQPQWKKDQSSLDRQRQDKLESD